MQPYLGYAIILIICVIVSLVAFDKINHKFYPFILYGIAASMVLMMPLAGHNLVGTDIHLEWYYNQLHTGGDVVAPVMGIPQGTSIITYLPASTWVLKIAYPMIFAFLPVILFLIFQKWLDEKRAFLASAVFIIFPSFFIELPFIARQMMAEVVLGVLLYLLIVSNLKLRHKVLPVIACSVLIPMIHYALWPVLVILATPWLVASLILKYKNTAKLVAISLVVVAVTGAVYFSFAEDGVVVRKLLRAYYIVTPSVLSLDTESVVVYPKIYEQKPAPHKATYEQKPVGQEATRESPSYLMKFEPLIRTAIGIDFNRISSLGKIFRVLQLIMMVLIFVGLWKLRKEKHYMVFASGAISFLLLCVILPELSGYLNITRVVHITLLLLAPAIAASMKPRYLLIYLIPYFIFSSGFIFEVTEQPNIENINIPYNIALSNHRIDLGASTTEDDLKVSDYIVEHELYPLYSDVYASYLVVEKIGLRDDINRPLPKGDIPDFSGSYIFFRSRNIQDSSLVIWNGVGCRFHWNWDHYGFNPEKNIVFQEGDARVIWIP